MSNEYDHLKRSHHSIFSNITFSDLFKIGAAIVSISIAWGVVSTRLAIIEHQQVILRDDRESLIAEVSRLKDRVDRLSRSEVESQYMLDDLWITVKGTPPRRK